MEGGDGESVRLGGGEGRGYFWSAAHQPSSPSSLNGAGMISEYLRKHHAVLIQRPVVRACVRVFLLVGWASASAGGWVGGSRKPCEGYLHVGMVAASCCAEGDSNIRTSQASTVAAVCVPE